MPCRRALSKKIKISLNSEYYRRKAAKQRQLEVFEVQAGNLSNELKNLYPEKPKPKPVSQTIIMHESNVLVSFC